MVVPGSSYGDRSNTGGYRQNYSWREGQIWDDSLERFDDFAQTSFSNIQMTISGSNLSNDINLVFPHIKVHNVFDGTIQPWNLTDQGDYPTGLHEDLEFSMSGRAVFTLPNGLTFDDLKQRTSTSYAREWQPTWEDWVDNYTLVMNVQAVPEPTSFGACAIILAGASLVLIRRRRAKNQA